MQPLTGPTARRAARARRPRRLPLPHRLRRPRPALTTGAGAVLVLPLLAAAPAFRAFFDYTAGVLTLVSLTAAVVWGLLAAGRTVLAPRSRLLAQGVHRALATASLGFLVLHIAVKVAESHALFSDAFLPFASVVLSGPVAPGTAPLIGFGTLAGLLMVLAAATGALRSAFAGRGRVSGRWRALHTSAYAAWCLALLHGLKSGRAPSGWVTTGYVLSLAAVMGALLARLLFTPCAEFPYFALRRELPFSLPFPARKRDRKQALHGAARSTSEPPGAAVSDGAPAGDSRPTGALPVPDVPTGAATGFPPRDARDTPPSWALADAPTETLPYVTDAPSLALGADGAPTERIPFAGFGAAPEWGGPPTLVQPRPSGAHPEGAPAPHAPNGRTP
ncbi:hypothetical protein [Streptomyces ochraceiscleroticus]|uniref:Ferric oxidoreductase domain-containing protein n=1 Tax=Streptomyces ochraceiscleroticus TaxID=47761 RepID=A0ABW1MEQ4_9ACTN|nr:hypothetical protein [Streptomyces ochraceiscleroticus]